MANGFRASLHTPLYDLLGCDVPVLLAGMGGVSRWELASAVANAGGMAYSAWFARPPSSSPRKSRP